MDQSDAAVGQAFHHLDRHAALLGQQQHVAKFGLRAGTDESPRKVLYLNQVAVSMRAWLIALAGAEQELGYSEHQLPAFVARPRAPAGVAEPAGVQPP